MSSPRDRVKPDQPVVVVDDHRAVLGFAALGREEDQPARGAGSPDRDEQARRAQVRPAGERAAAVLADGGQARRRRDRMTDREAEVALARAGDVQVRADGHPLAGRERPRGEEARPLPVGVRLQRARVAAAARPRDPDRPDLRRRTRGGVPGFPDGRRRAAAEADLRTGRGEAGVRRRVDVERRRGRGLAERGEDRQREEGGPHGGPQLAREGEVAGYDATLRGEGEYPSSDAVVRTVRTGPRRPPQRRETPSNAPRQRSEEPRCPSPCSAGSR